MSGVTYDEMVIMNEREGGNSDNGSVAIFAMVTEPGCFNQQQQMNIVTKTAARSIPEFLRSVTITAGGRVKCKYQTEF
jgi:hypothetical protein